MKKSNLNSQRIQTSYKKPNPNFAQQLCAFLSQSKQSKQQQIQSINQQMIEQFIHLFEISNINRFIDYTSQFINQIRNVILRLQIVQKRAFQSFDEKDQYVYLVFQGKVQKIKRHKPVLIKRNTRLNLTSLNFGSNFSLLNSLNTRNSHQTFNNAQMRQIQKSMIMNRSSRMSMTQGNLWNELSLSPRKKNKSQDKLYKTFSPNSSQMSPFVPFKAKASKFKEKIEQQKESSSDQQINEQKNEVDKNQQKIQFLEPLEEETYQCLTRVKYIKLLKWSYDQLVQYIFKYQNDRLIKFLARTLLISQNQIKFYQIYNKTIYHYFRQKSSQYSNQQIKLQTGSIYILRKGSVQFKYQYRNSFTSNESRNNKQQQIKNPYLANYLNQEDCFYKKIILNEGAVIYPQLQKKAFFVQSLQDVVFIQINAKLIEYLKNEVRNDWWNNKFCQYYKKINEQRSLYMKDQEVYQQQEKVQFKMQNVYIKTKNRRLHSAKAQNTRFRIECKENNQPVENQQIKEEIKNEQMKQNNEQNEFSNEEYRQFVSLLPYEIMVKSKQKISMKLNQKAKAKHISDKVFNYLKKHQKSKTASKYKHKVLQLKMKNIASKQINAKDLNVIYQDINKNSIKQQFHQSLKGNWFKEQTDHLPQNISTQSIHKKSSQNSDFNKQNLPLQRKNINKSSTQIIALNKKFNESKKKFTINTIQSTQYDQKKVTFALNNLNTLDDQSDEEFLCNDDTGLINKFVQKSHNYQKEISFLINSSQRQDKFQNHKKKKLKTCKTQGNHLLFSHNLINDILKRINLVPNKNSINSNKTSNKPSNTASKCASVCNQNDQFNDADQTNKNDCDKVSIQRTQSNIFSEIFSQLRSKNHQSLANRQQNNQFSKQKDVIEEKQSIMKNKKTSSFTNYSSSKSSSSKFLKSKNKNEKRPISYNRKTLTQSKQNDTKQCYIQSTFYEQKHKRPVTAMQAGSRTQCKSLMFNKWIETQPGTNYFKQQRNSQLGVGNYNYCQRNISTGDKKIWKRLKSGKIVKKSIKYFNKQNSSNKEINKSTQIH